MISACIHDPMDYNPSILDLALYRNTTIAKHLLSKEYSQIYKKSCFINPINYDGNRRVG